MGKDEIIKRLEEMRDFYLENLKLDEEEKKDVYALDQAVKMLKEQEALEKQNEKLKKENRGYVVRLRNAELMGTYRKAANR